MSTAVLNPRNVSINSGTPALGLAGGIPTYTYGSSTYTLDHPDGFASIPTNLPPPKQEQNFDNLAQSQAVSVIMSMLEAPETQKVLRGLIGRFECPTEQDVIEVLHMLRKDINVLMPEARTTNLNAVQSCANLLEAVSKELSTLVALGRAQIVEKITK